MQRRILIFSTAYTPFVGGAEIAIKEITDRIPGTEFIMVTARLDPSLPSRERIGNIDVHRIGKGSVWDKYSLIFFGPRLAMTLGHFDTVWSIMASYAGFAGLRYKKKNSQTKFVLTLQEGDSRFDIYKHVWWCWPYFKSIFLYADHIHAISTYLASWAKRLGAQASVSVVPNGVRNEFLLGLCVAQKKKRIITVSRLVKKNGLDMLIRALPFLPADTQLVVAGDGGLRGELTVLARALGVMNRVQFLGNIPQTALPALLRDARVFCRPSRSEGLGTAFLEAMAVGVPIVAPAIGGIVDFLSDGETGLVCRVDDPKDVAEKIERIFSDSALATQLSRNARALIDRSYRWDTIAPRIAEIL